MKLPQSALIKVARIGILDNPVHVYGPKKYWLFGERRILATFNLPGRMRVSDARIDFGEHTVVEGTKLPMVMFDQHTYFGVIPYEETAPNVWECGIDHFRSRN